MLLYIANLRSNAIMSRAKKWVILTCTVGILSLREMQPVRQASTNGNYSGEYRI